MGERSEKKGSVNVGIQRRMYEKIQTRRLGKMKNKNWQMGKWKNESWKNEKWEMEKERKTKEGIRNEIRKEDEGKKKKESMYVTGRMYEKIQTRRLGKMKNKMRNG